MTLSHTDWEEVNDELVGGQIYSKTTRLRVSGGWLYRYLKQKLPGSCEHEQAPVAIVFVPDRGRDQ